MPRTDPTARLVIPKRDAQGHPVLPPATASRLEQAAFAAAYVLDLQNLSRYGFRPALRFGEDTRWGPAEFADLLRFAAESDGWALSEARGRPVLPGKFQRPMLREIAAAIEQEGLREELLPIPSPSHYHGIQQALALRRFKLQPDRRWPAAPLERGDAKGYAELRNIAPEEEHELPPEVLADYAGQMVNLAGQLSDADADVLDALSVTWIERARNPRDAVLIGVDEILGLRGLKPHPGGAGRRGGFKREQRAAVVASVHRLSRVWLDIPGAAAWQGKGKSRKREPLRVVQAPAFMLELRAGQRRLDGTLDVDMVAVRPGVCLAPFMFGAGRQVALMSARALQFHPERQAVEKRLLRFVAWQWRIAASSGGTSRAYKVETLLAEAGLKVDAHDPGRSRARLEKALDLLEQHGDLDAWQYGDGWREDELPRQGWLPFWLEARIELEAPEALKVAYEKLARAPVELPRLPAGLGERLREERRRRGLTQLQLAEELEVSRPLVAQLESGRRRPSADVARKVERWLAEDPAATT